MTFSVHNSNYLNLVTIEMCSFVFNVCSLKHDSTHQSHFHTEVFDGGGGALTFLLGLLYHALEGIKRTQESAVEIRYLEFIVVRESLQFPY